MKLIYTSFFAIIIALMGSLLAFSSQAVAYDEDECSIWLCLPGGFPSGCGGAKSAMKDRLEDGKSPLPSFSSCSVEVDAPTLGEHYSEMSLKRGTYAYLPPARVCTSWDVKHGGHNDGDRRCVRYENLPEEYIWDASCDGHADTNQDIIGGVFGGKEGERPCSMRTYWQVMADGKPLGKRFSPSSWRSLE